MGRHTISFVMTLHEGLWTRSKPSIDDQRGQWARGRAFPRFPRPHRGKLWGAIYGLDKERPYFTV